MAWAILAQIALCSSALGEPDEPRSAEAWLDEAYRHKAARDLEAAGAAFQAARNAGGDRQLIALELGYLAIGRGDLNTAHTEFERATLGGNAAYAAQARRELAAMSGDAQPNVADDPDGKLAASPRAGAWLEYARRRKAAGDLEEAAAAVRSAVRAGANRQLASLEFGFIAALRKQPEDARVAFLTAMKGRDPALAEEAQRQLLALGPPQQPSRHGHRQRRARGRRAGRARRFAANDPAHFYLDAGYRLKGERKLAAATAAFEVAKATGANQQLVDLELGYLAADRRQTREAGVAFERAAAGPDPAIAAEARGRLQSKRLVTSTTVPGFWADLYGEAYGWTRFYGQDRTTNLVPTLRARLLYGPLLHVDLHGYVLAEVSRDLASRGSGRDGQPIIYSDNKALLAGGLLLRLWDGRVGVFGQFGPAIELVKDTRKRIRIDARVGAFLGLESQACWPTAAAQSGLRLSACNEVYAEVTYLSRFDHDVVGFARGRTGAGFAVTGPLLWQVVAEGRIGKDSNRDYYNNFVDLGVGGGARLLAPFHAELLLGVHSGSYFGESNRDPAPRPLRYSELRLQAATYVEF